MPNYQEIIDCAISSWHPQFAGVTFATIVLPLPDEFVAWLQADGVHLASISEAFPARGKIDQITAEDDYREWSSDDEGSEAGADPAPDFEELRAAVAAAIAELGGAVAPKLTWSCPKDATWMLSGGSLRCRNAGEVLLLLKSSDRVAHDVSNAFDACAGTIPEPSGAAAAAEARAPGGAAAPAPPAVRHVLALRRWHDLKPGREFRCFVRGGRLVGISQRDVTQRFEALEAEAGAIQQRIQAFYAAAVAGRFPQPSFTFDCYVPSAAAASVRLLDFNPAGGTTAPLLFESQEVWPRAGGAAAAAAAAGGEAEPAEPAEFRIITEPVALRPDKAAYGVPFDFVDDSEGSALSALLEQARQADGVWEGLHRKVAAASAAAAAAPPPV